MGYGEITCSQSLDRFVSEIIIKRTLIYPLINIQGDATKDLEAFSEKKKEKYSGE